MHINKKHYILIHFIRFLDIGPILWLFFILTMPTNISRTHLKRETNATYGERNRTLLFLLGTWSYNSGGFLSYSTFYILHRIMRLFTATFLHFFTIRSVAIASSFVSFHRKLMEHVIIIDCHKLQEIYYKPKNLHRISWISVSTF